MKLLREPLLYFLLAGTLLFLLSDRVTEDAERTIEVTESEQAMLVDQWQARFGRQPTPQELDAIIDQWVRHEILYREAIAAGLYENDPVIRRRLIQKLEFLGESQGDDPPDQAEARAYYQQHADRYTAPVRYTFTHRFFSQQREDPQADARQALEALKSGQSPQGDPFPVQSADVERWSARDVAQLFGSDFAQALTTMEVGSWHGPVRSSFGWHVVKVSHKHPAEQLPFEEVASRVVADYQQERRREESAAYYQSVRDKYRVIRP